MITLFIRNICLNFSSSLKEFFSRVVTLYVLTYKECEDAAVVCPDEEDGEGEEGGEGQALHRQPHLPHNLLITDAYV